MNPQIEIISLEDPVSANHIYRKARKLIELDKTSNQHLTAIVGNSHDKGYGSNLLFKALVLQHLEESSDRKLERVLQENTAAKWFCSFTLSDKTR